MIVPVPTAAAAHVMPEHAGPRWWILYGGAGIVAALFLLLWLVGDEPAAVPQQAEAAVVGAEEEREPEVPEEQPKPAPTPEPAVEEQSKQPDKLQQTIKSLEESLEKELPPVGSLNRRVLSAGYLLQRISFEVFFEEEKSKEETREAVLRDAQCVWKVANDSGLNFRGVWFIARIRRFAEDEYVATVIFDEDGEPQVQWEGALK